MSQRPWWSRCRGLLFLLATLGPVAATAADEPRCPRAEDYYATGNTAGFIARGKQFLKDHPQHESAPRLAFDLMIVATVAKDSALMEEMQGLLTLEYAESLPARYLTATTGDASKYCTLLKGLTKKREDVFSDRFIRQFCRAVSLGLAQWGPNLLADDEFLLQAALMAYAAGDYRLSSCFGEKLAQSSGQTRQIADIAFAAAKDSVAKTVQLHGVQGNETARFFERFFASKLAPAQRELPQIITLLAENHLAANEFGEALGLIEKLPARQTDPRLMFLSAWCHAELGHTRQSLTVLEELQAKHPASPWAAQAKVFAGYVRDLDQNLGQYAEALHQAISRVRRGEVGMAEVTLVYQPDGERKLEIYASAVPQRGELTLIALQGRRIIAGYTASQRESRFFFNGEPVIQAFSPPCTYLATQASLSRGADGQFGYNFNFQCVPSPDAMSGGVRMLLASPYLRDADVLRELLRGLILARGWLPTGVKQDADGTCFAWVRPVPATPTLDRWEFRLSRDGDFQSLITPSWSCRLRYGPLNAIRFSPPSWPPLPLVRHEKMDMGILFRALGVAYSMFASEPDQTASKPQAASR